MKLTLTLLSLLFAQHFLLAQCDTNRYVNPIFSTVYKHADVKYGEAPVWSFPYSNTDLLMDIYEPIGDVLAKRPLMLWVHPGGFINGDKGVDDMVALCDSFARRGYVTASIGYRLGMNPLSTSSAERAVYRGTQDVRAAIRYLMEYSDVYDIDTTSIFLGGSSAGSFAVLHVVYGDQNEIPSSVYGGFLDPDLGCMDCTGNTHSHEVSLAGYVDLWGAIGDSSWINSDETTPGLLIHGIDDDVVPFGVGYAFNLPTLPLSHGSRSVHNSLDALGIDHTFIPFPGEGHEPHGASNGTFNSTPTPYWDTIFNAVSDHYFSILQPNDAPILGDEIVCETDSIWYSVNINSGESACWMVQNGTIVESLSDSILVQWSQGTGSVSVRVMSELDAASNESILAVVINPLPSNVFTSVANGTQYTFDLSGSGIASVDWDFGDSFTGSGQIVDHVYTQEGTFVVNAVITGVNGCVNYASESVTISFASVSSIEEEETFNLFPSPTEDKLTVINVPNGAGVIVTDAIGNQLISTEALGSEVLLEVQNFSDGIYLVTVVNNGNRRTKRFVKR